MVREVSFVDKVACFIYNRVAMTARTSILTIVTLLALTSLPAAQVLPDEAAVLQKLDVNRTLGLTRQLSEDVVKNNSGVGAGSAVAAV